MKNLKMNLKKGFSLVELLVVIAVIGVIAAIAIPAMSGIFGKADSAKTDRNAQNIVSSFNAARAAGNKTSYTAATAITAVTTSPGINGDGVFLSSAFYCPVGAVELALADDQIVAVGSGADLSLAIDPAIAILP